MSLKGLENAIRNLNSLDRHMVPQASAWAVIRYVYDRGVDGSGRCGADAGTKT